jgi:hypothetical protein
LFAKNVKLGVLNAYLAYILMPFEILEER